MLHTSAVTMQDQVTYMYQEIDQHFIGR